MTALIPHYSYSGLPTVARSLLLAALTRVSELPCLVVLGDGRGLETVAQDLECLLRLLEDLPEVALALRQELRQRLPNLSLVQERPAEVLVFPAQDKELLSELSPERGVVLRRMATLDRLRQAVGPTCLLTEIDALISPLLPGDLHRRHARVLKAGERTELHVLAAALAVMGYEREEVVEEPGNFALRGGLLDVWSPVETWPCRVEFFDDEVESLRSFDPENQRSLQPLIEYRVCPAKELLLGALDQEVLAQRLKRLGDSQDVPRERREAIIETLRRGQWFHGLERLTATCYGEAAHLLEELGPRLVILPSTPLVTGRLLTFEAEVAERFDRARKTGALVTPPAEQYVAAETLRTYLLGNPGLRFDDPGIDLGPSRKLSLEAEDLTGIGGREHVMREFEGSVLAFFRTRCTLAVEHGVTPVVVTHTALQARRAAELLACDHYQVILDESRLAGGASSLEPGVSLRGKVLVTEGRLSGSVDLPHLGILLLAEQDLFGQVGRRRRQTRAREVAAEFSGDLRDGDYVVHLHHGIGRYQGLVRLSFGTAGSAENDFLLLEYRDGDKLYLPVDRMNLVQRYVGAEGGHPALDKLGGPAWERKRSKAKKEVGKIASDLVRLYARRKISEGFSFSPPDKAYLEFEAGFPYEETDQQLRAIEEVLDDMTSPTLMDRLVCGDVGFGKTEVALRATFKAVLDGKQVAFLVPTTVLCQQHYLTLKERFRDHPINVDFLSRFKLARNERTVLEQVRDGRIDVLVGTHRLLSKDVLFKDLGLLVVDEEHRFGVRHKERIKELKANLDVLTLTATPIPRTLQLSLLGLRDVSLINTPPVDRQAIRNTVARFSSGVIVEAVTRELRRGGQIFFVHNRVQDIDNLERYLLRLMPELRLTIVHGQMDEVLIEERMLAFINREVDLLLCTSIIESGLDIPNANTIIINRADCFGLSQLYQLRGRVGRSKRRGYAYFLVPEHELVTEDAQRRLEAIEEFSRLGSGFRVASRDLEIRGGGNILGEAQSGHIAAIGLELYTQLLEEEIKRMKGEDVVPEIDPVLTINIPARIPPDYVLEPGARLRLYRRFAMVETQEDLVALVEELQDRYGPLPEELENFVEIIGLKVLARAMRIKGVVVSGMVNSLQLCEHSLIDLDRLLALLHREQHRLKLTPDNSLVISSRDASSLTIFADLRWLLKEIAERDGENAV